MSKHYLTEVKITMKCIRCDRVWSGKYTTRLAARNACDAEKWSETADGLICPECAAQLDSETKTMFIYNNDDALNWLKAYDVTITGDSTLPYYTDRGVLCPVEYAVSYSFTWSHGGRVEIGVVDYTLAIKAAAMYIKLWSRGFSRQLCLELMKGYVKLDT